MSEELGTARWLPGPATGSRRSGASGISSTSPAGVSALPVVL
jgi:hypothetical protein